jgi:hypothetical protein
VKIKTINFIYCLALIIFFFGSSYCYGDNTNGPYNLLQQLKNLPKTKLNKIQSTVPKAVKKVETKAIEKVKTPKPVQNKLDIIAEQNIENTNIIFPWAEPVNMASYIKNEHLYVIFDKKIPTTVKLLNNYINSQVVEHALIDNFYVYDIGKESTCLVFKLIGKNIDRKYISVFKDHNSVEIKISSQKVQQKIINFLSKPFEIPTATIEFSTQKLGESKIISFIDPINGDKTTILAVKNYQYSIKNYFSYVDLDIMSTVQGIAIAEKSDGLIFNKDNNLFWIISKYGLNISSKYNSSDGNSIYHASGFSRLPEFENSDGILTLKPYEKDFKNYVEAEKILKKKVYDSSIDEQYKFRINLALLNLANGFYPEADTYLKYSYINNPLLKNKFDFLLICAVSTYMKGDYKKADNIINRIDLSTVPVKNLNEVRLWQDIISLPNEKDSNLSNNLIEIFSKSNEVFLNQYPKNILTKLKLFELKFLIKNNYFYAAQNTVKELSEFKLNGEDKAEMYYEIANLQKHLLNHKAEFKFLTKCKDVPDSLYYSSKCEFDYIDYEFKNKIIDVDVAINKFQMLDFKIRNSDMEIGVLNKIAELYLMKEDYINSLLTWRVINKYFPDKVDSLIARENMTKTFTSIFLTTTGKKYSAFEKVAIFDEFSDLNPIGSEGDKIALKLSDNLIQLDLLQRAASILEHQYKFRLIGYQKEATLNKLLEVYLELNRPRDVIKYLDAESSNNLSGQIIVSRNYLYAEALSQAEEYDKAIEILEGDLSNSADSVRTNVYWKLKNWNAFNDNSEPYIYSLINNQQSLSNDDAEKILKQSISYSFLGRKRLLLNLYNNFKERLAIDHQKQLDVIHLLVKLQFNNNKESKILNTQDIQNIVNDVYNQMIN